MVPHFLDSGSGTPVVLLHGFPFSAAMWHPQRQLLTAECRLITPDQRGFGATPLGDDHPSLDLVADDVAAMLDQLGLEDVVLGGLSMGGYVAMAFLRRYPHRVRGLILADTRASADGEAERANRLRVAHVVEKAGSVDEFFTSGWANRLTSAATKANQPDLVAQLHNWIRISDRSAVAWAHRAMANRGESFDVLASFAGPALVIVGEEDDLAPVTQADELVAALPDVRYVRIPQTGHMSNLENPAAFNSAIRDFLGTFGKSAP